MSESITNVQDKIEESVQMNDETRMVGTPEQIAKAEATVDRMIKRGDIKEKDRENEIKSLFPLSAKGTQELLTLIKRSWY